jgi:hypothetical protein
VAWADTPYATTSEYRERNGRVSTDSDTTLAALILSLSRVVDRRLGVGPAGIAPQSAVTLTFRSPDGGRLLYLRDEQERQHFLRTATAIGIDSEGDNTFDGYTLVLGTDTELRGYPINATTYGEPYTALELMPGVSGASPAAWPKGAEVRITGNWGYTAIPGAIKDRVISLTRELVQVHLGGALTDEMINAALEANIGARSLMHLLEMEYSRRIPAFGA